MNLWLFEKILTIQKQLDRIESIQRVVLANSKKELMMSAELDAAEELRARAAKLLAKQTVQEPVKPTAK